MLPEIKLTISQNNEIIETVNKAIENQRLVKSLEEFQVEANAALTKMIEEIGDISKAGGDGMDDNDEDDDQDEDEEDADSSPSLNDKQKGHSQSKKKKHS